ncbi:toll-interacting protein-like [Uloborus diversus]|uniref:toll-interacting protein-like n=1 Tax=Uloborus diversus TaxID=327109 RepID=UPI00240A9C48|nr:toll-interacting protein-like [Uloborus diversus]
MFVYFHIAANMASCNSHSNQLTDKREERRKQVMIGELPSDFLRVSPISAEQQLALDEQAALALQQQLSGSTLASPVAGRITITVVEAKLNKNYGIARMDPYVRLRIGQTVYETNTDYNGARNPRWDKSFHCFYFANDTCIHIEIYDECAFSLDEKIAWTDYEIPDPVLQGQSTNEWIELSGKLGEGKEGSIKLVITCQPIPSGTLLYHPQQIVTVMPYNSSVKTDGSTEYQPGSLPNTQPSRIDASNVSSQQPIEISEEDLKQIKEMFPNIEEDVIRTVLESNGGNKDHTINSLLALSE